jgi:hypothetical protein
MQRSIYSIYAALFCIAFACAQESEFSGAPPAEAKKADSDVGGDAGGDLTGGENGPGGGIDAKSDAGSSISSVCEDGENTKFKWPAEIQSCFDSQGFYHFETKQCYYFETLVSQCSWDSVLSKLKENGLSSDFLEKQKNSGSKIVSCSETKNDKGYFFSVQSISVENLEKVSCEQLKGGAGIFTGCYTRLAAGQDDIDKSSVENSVKDCATRGSRKN